MSNLNADLVQFYESIDAVKVLQWVRDRRQEDNRLDFKTFGERGDCREFLSQDRAILAKALSGFANAEGGVVVWGVDARPDSRIDAARKAVPIDSLGRALTRMKELTHATVSPSIKEPA